MKGKYAQINFRNKTIKTPDKIFNEKGGDTIIALHGIGPNPDELFRKISK